MRKTSLVNIFQLNRVSYYHIISRRSSIQWREYVGSHDTTGDIGMIMAPERIATNSSTSTHDDDTSSNEVHQEDPDEAECIVPMDLEKQNTAASATSSLNQRAQSVISRIRSRDPNQVTNFTHALSHTKTGPDVLVDFEGEDDTYHPRNWPFRKKAITTVLYGLTTMGKQDTCPASFVHQ